MTSSITAILFCGGKGSRLYPISEYYQKTMMPIGKNGTPALELIIKHLKSFGIMNYVALIGYRANQVRSYFGSGDDLGVSISYITDDPKMKGTGGALLNAKDQIKSDQLLLYYTDVISNINIQELADFHKGHSRLGSIWVDPNWEMQNIIIKKNENDKIESITNKAENILVNTSICLINRKILDEIEEYYDSNPDVDDIDLSRDIFPRLAENRELVAYLTNDWWFDIGSLKKYQQLDESFIASKFSHLEDV